MLPLFFQRALGLDERRCVVCHRPCVSVSGETATLCLQCTPRLARYTAAYCPLCGEPAMVSDGPSVMCGACIAEPPPWSALRFYGIYAGVLQELLLRLKFGADFSVTRLLGGLMAEICMEMPPVQMVIPLPQHPSRLRTRGFNQAHELAKTVAQRLGVPVKPERLTRTVATRPQEGLTARQRKSNPRGSFAAHDIAGGTVLLLDDTMTTGSTLRHATLALRESGAADIFVAVAARTPPPLLHSSLESA